MVYDENLTNHWSSEQLGSPAGVAIAEDPMNLEVVDDVDPNRLMFAVGIMKIITGLFMQMAILIPTTHNQKVRLKSKKVG